jgi:hypothetical protein
LTALIDGALLLQTPTSEPIDSALGQYIHGVAGVFVFAFHKAARERELLAAHAQRQREKVCGRAARGVLVGRGGDRDHQRLLGRIAHELRSVHTP